MCLDKRIEPRPVGYATSTDERVAQCVEACLACAGRCDDAAGLLVQRGERRDVDALIAGTATARLVADLLREDVEIDRGVLDLCIVALERCGELGVDEVVEPCAEAVRCLRVVLDLSSATDS